MQNKLSYNIKKKLIRSRKFAYKNIAASYAAI